MIPDEPPPVSVHGRDEATTLTQAVLNQPPVPRTPSLHVLPRHRHPSARSRGEERAACVRTCVRAYEPKDESQSTQETTPGQI